MLQNFVADPLVKQKGTYLMSRENQSPYLIEGRLADVIAAITALGNYKYYKLSFEGWAERISGLARRADYWEKIFRQHPEFFRIDTEDRKVSLVWRRQYPKNYNVDSQTSISPSELNKYAEDRMSRRPLEANEVTSLIAVAVDLHERALDQQKASKWWVTIAAGILSFAGALLGAYLKGPK
jgi:hypothetical protein